MKIVGFTGTQHGLAVAQHYALREYLLSLDIKEFHHGDCIGADEQAHAIMANRVRIVVHPSNLTEKRAYCIATTVFPPKPPLTRNRDIVAAVEHLIGCPKTMHEEMRSGTWATIREAFRKARNVSIVWPNGRIQESVNYSELE